MVLDFIQSVISLALRWPLSVTSWGRTEKHNRAIGGHPQSWHLLWLGLDVVLDDGLENEAFEADCKLVGIHPIFEVDHYHLQPTGISR